MLSSKASFSGLMANALFLALAVVAALRGIALICGIENGIQNLKLKQEARCLSDLFYGTVK